MTVIKKTKKEEDLTKYKTLGLTLLQLMGSLAIIGIVVALILNYFFK